MTEDSGVVIVRTVSIININTTRRREIIPIECVTACISIEVEQVCSVEDSIIDEDVASFVASFESYRIRTRHAVYSIVCNGVVPRIINPKCAVSVVIAGYLTIGDDVVGAGVNVDAIAVCGDFGGTAYRVIVGTC